MRALREPDDPLHTVTLAPQNGQLVLEDYLRLLRANRHASVLVTDESSLYDEIKTLLPHRTVTHSREFVTGDAIHTQGIEGFWSLLKRQLNGTHHHVSAGLLGMYADEAAFKYNTRTQSDGERFASALQGANGRLTWYVGRASEGESPSAS